MIFKPGFYCLILSVATSSCSTDTESDDVDAALRTTNAIQRARFADLGEALTAEHDFVRWQILKANLERDFDGICGDTFCEGDYGNYQSLALKCALDVRRSNVEHCVWVFAASQHEIDPATGAIAVTARHWECTLPLASRTPLQEFLRLSSAEQPLNAPLPRTIRTAYDGLIDCL